jgi:23S rRNA maturation-related 3'-5' exoribonuclease YhaM
MPIDVFANEIKLIENMGIKKMVWKCLENAPSYFWGIPSSSTGKYHPKDENVNGGLVIHTKRAVKMANYLCECLGIKNIERDCVLAACIMHDLCKQGFPDNKEHTVDGHGFVWTELARSVFTKNEIKDNQNFSLISRLILMHMGKYDLPYVLDWSDELATIVHIADFISSRDDILVNVSEK